MARPASLGPRRIAYVACDPTALARDLMYFREAGYVPRRLRAFDLFPVTYHVECVAILEPAAKRSWAAVHPVAAARKDDARQLVMAPAVP